MVKISHTLHYRWPYRATAIPTRNTGLTANATSINVEIFFNYLSFESEKLNIERIIP